MHGFYVDEDTKNIYFDLIIDFKAGNPKEIQQNGVKVYYKVLEIQRMSENAGMCSTWNIGAYI